MQRPRRDTPALMQSPCGRAVPDDACDELEEKTDAVHLGGLEEISMEDESEELEKHHQPKAWSAAPTMVHLPSRKHPSVGSNGTALRPLQPPAAPVKDGISHEEGIDTDVFNALPPEIQQEILAERTAQMVLDMESIDAERGTREHSSREASFGEGETVLRVGEGWVCRVCTFANHPQLIECEICETLRIQTGDYSGDSEGEADEVRAARRTSTPTSSNSRSRTSSTSNELYSKLSKTISSTAMSKSLRKIRLPASPAAAKLTMKADPTAEDLLIAATAKIQKLQSSASQSFHHAKKTIIAKASSSTGRKNSLRAEPRLPSLAAASELAVLQRDLNSKCEPGDEVYESLLERLWNAIYQDAPTVLKIPTTGEGSLPRRAFARVSDGWVDIGFQGSNPDTDFRGGGLLALKCLVYAFEAFPQKMLEIVLSQTPSNGKKWYPVCVAGINLTCMIAGLLQLGNGRYEETAESFWNLFEEPSAFYQLFFYGEFAFFCLKDTGTMIANPLYTAFPAFVKMDATWRRMNTSYMEFGGACHCSQYCCWVSVSV